MSGLEIRWPDARAEQVRAARGRLETAREALQTWPFEARLAAVAQVVEAWTTPDSPWRRELAGSLADTGVFERGTVSEGLDAALRAWKPADLVACARRELGFSVPGERPAPRASEDGMQPHHRSWVPYDWTAVLCGGALPMPTLLSGLLPLILGSPVLMRESSKDTATAALLARSLAAQDARLAAAFEAIRFPVDDTTAFDEVLAAPCVVATGSDETIAAIRARLAPSQRLVAYGHRFSIGVVGPEAADDLDGVARRLALDVARWDQSGCLSPVAVYLLELGEKERRRFAEACSLALESLSARMPRGELSTAARATQATERAEAGMRAASGRGLLCAGSDSTVVLEVDARPRPAPLRRFLRLHPVASIDQLETALRPFAGHLSNVAVDGLPHEHKAPLETRLARLGVSRFTHAGCLQTPPIDWPHDGLPLLLPMCRFVHSD